MHGDEAGGEAAGATSSLPSRPMGPRDPQLPLHGGDREHLLARVLSVEGNEACADCGTPSPDWVVRVRGFAPRALALPYPGPSHVHPLSFPLPPSAACRLSLSPHSPC